VKIASLIKTLGYTNSPGQAVICKVFDIPTNSPLFTIKIYNSGFMTTALKTTAIIFDYKNLKLEFIGYIRETDPCPV